MLPYLRNQLQRLKNLTILIKTIVSSKNYKSFVLIRHVCAVRWDGGTPLRRCGLGYLAVFELGSHEVLQRYLDQGMRRDYERARLSETLYGRGLLAEAG